MPFGFSHDPLVRIAGSAITSFYRKIEVYGSEDVPAEGPIIFACTHTNMAIDPAVLSNTVPYRHFLHYWVKDSLFKNPMMKKILTNAGNIPVDRKNKNNQLLFRGTFEALAVGECIGVFPEGTSHTEPHLIPLKDGTSWTALEYLVYLRDGENGKPRKGKSAVIVPVGIAYCDKSKYRSRLAVTYGAPITMDAYREQFLSGEEGANKLAVKRLTKATELELHKMTVNAPDWATAFAAQMARELMWKTEDRLALADYVDVAQTLTDLFATQGNPRIDQLKELLCTYRDLLFASRLSNSVLTDLRLPATLDPNAVVPLPGRIRTLAILIKDSLVCAFYFPLFVVPFLFNIPVYLIGTFGAHLAEDELETQAQNKVFLGLFLSIICYPVFFFMFLGAFWGIPLATALAAGAVWLMGRYHAALIDVNYKAFKRLVAAWRVLVGVWLGPNVEMSLNKFVDNVEAYAPDPPMVAGLPPGTQAKKYVKPERLPSRVLIGHVLRTRNKAALELASVLLELEEQDTRVKASFWLAEAYGGDVLPPAQDPAGLAEYEQEWPRGERGGREIVAFLRGRGARIQAAQSDAHWAAAPMSPDLAAMTGDKKLE